MQDTTVIAGPASVELSEKIAKELGAKLVAAELRVFSDGESKIKLGGIANNCVIVQSTYPPVDMHIMQALMISKKCADEGAQDVCVVIPYLAYSRQDREFLKGEAVTASLVAKMFDSAGANHIVTVDVHSRLAISYFSSLENISSIPQLADHALKMNLHDPIAISPDLGGKERANEFSNRLNTELITLKKTRDRTTGEVTINEELDVDVTGRDAIIIDDMISSGGSIVKAARVLRDKGAGHVYAMCAHALLIGDAPQKIRAAGVYDIIATNSIPSEYAKVDLSPTIAEVIKKRYS